MEEANSISNGASISCGQRTTQLCPNVLSQKGEGGVGKNKDKKKKKKEKREDKKWKREFNGMSEYNKARYYERIGDPHGAAFWGGVL